MFYSVSSARSTTKKDQQTETHSVLLVLVYDYPPNSFFTKMLPGLPTSPIVMYVCKKKKKLNTMWYIPTLHLEGS